MNENGQIPGKSAEIASLVLGIASVVCWFFGYFSFLSIVCGIVGLILAGSARNAGFISGLRTAGFVLSLIGLVGGAFVLIACVACAGSISLLDTIFY